MSQYPSVLNLINLQLPMIIVNFVRTLTINDASFETMRFFVWGLSNSDELGSLLMMSYFCIYVLVLAISVLIISTIESLAS